MESRASLYDFRANSNEPAAFALPRDRARRSLRVVALLGLLYALRLLASAMAASGRPTSVTAPLQGSLQRRVEGMAGDLSQLQERVGAFEEQVQRGELARVLLGEFEDVPEWEVLAGLQLDSALSLLRVEKFRFRDSLADLLRLDSVDLTGLFSVRAAPVVYRVLSPSAVLSLVANSPFAFTALVLGFPKVV